MTREIRTINLILVVTGLAVSIVGLLQVLINRNIEAKTRSFFSKFFSVLTLYVACILTRELTYHLSGHGWVVLSRVVLFGQAFFASVLTILITTFLLYLSGETDWIKSRIFTAAAALWFIYTALLLYNIFSGRVFRVDDNNVYQRGPLYPVLVAPTVLIMLVNLFAVWYKRDKLTHKLKLAFIVYSVVPMIAMVIQVRFFGVHMIALSSVIAAFLMLTYIISDQTEQYYMKEVENARLELDILLAQIQPHFLYNSLMTIKHLCAEDPESAQDAIDRFMMYVRHNMDSLTADKPIPFLQELEHVKGYLALQNLRFGDDLSVEYDIEFTDFKLPTLTLQPLVENAVTYGVRKTPTGRGKVVIRTRRMGDKVEVTVEDDGPGFIFDANAEDKHKAHIGIANVKKRLESISGGELVYDSVIGKGTKAIIRLTLGEK